MPRIHHTPYLKKLVLAQMKALGHDIGDLAHLLSPPINAKTLDRLLKTDQILSFDRRSALAGYLVRTLKTVEEFEQSPQEPKYFELLSRAVATCYDLSGKDIQKKVECIGRLEAEAARVEIFDTRWPDDIYACRCRASEQEALTQRDNGQPADAVCRPARVITMLGATLDETPPRNTVIENAIYAVKVHRLNLRVADGLAAQFPKLLCRFAQVTIYDSQTAMLRCHHDREFLIVNANASPDHAYVVNTLQSAMANLDRYLLHARDPAAVVSLLESKLSQKSWLIRKRKFFGHD